jgi:uroporphyrinogen-III synthase
VRVVVTRPAEQGGPLVERLQKLGHEVTVCPLIEVRPLGDARIDLSAYDWVVVTSANGARELVRRMDGRLPKVAAIGPGTAAVLEEYGITVGLVPAVPLAPPAFPDADLVVLASGSAARSYARLGVDLPAVSIGPQTTAAALEHGVKVVAEASTHDLDGLVAAVDEAASAAAPGADLAAPPSGRDDSADSSV